MDSIFTGIGAAAVASLLTAFFTFFFQKRLLKQQLEFQKKLLEQQLAEGEKAQKEFIKFLETVTHGFAVSGAALRNQIFDCGRAICDTIDNPKKP